MAGLARVLFNNAFFSLIAFTATFLMLNVTGKKDTDLLPLFALIYVCVLPVTLLIQRIADRKFVSQLHFTNEQLRLIYANQHLELPLDSVQFMGPQQAAFFVPVDQDYVKILDREGNLLVEVDESWSDRIDLLRYLEKHEFYKARIPVIERDEQLMNMKSTIKTGLGAFSLILMMVLALIGISSYGILALVPAFMLFIYLYRDLLSHLTTKAK